MRGSVFLLAALLVTPLIASAPSPNDCATVEKNGNETALRVESWDPVLAIGVTIADRYGIKVSVEAPKWAFPGDTEDVAVAHPEFSEQHDHIHFDVMRRHAIEVRFSTSGNGHPADVAGLLRQLADAANREMPYEYRLDVSGDDYALVPTRTRNSNGELQDVLPLLDRRVTISSGTRSIVEHAKLMADELGKQTGLRIGCCKSSLTGIPWGMAEVKFEADHKPAREVLKSLMLIEQQANSQSSSGHPDYDHWVVRCDGTGVPYCSIQLEGKLPSWCP